MFQDRGGALLVVLDKLLEPLLNLAQRTLGETGQKVRALGRRQLGRAGSSAASAAGALTAVRIGPSAAARGGCKSARVMGRTPNQIARAVIRSILTGADDCPALAQQLLDDARHWDGLEVPPGFDEIHRRDLDRVAALLFRPAAETTSCSISAICPTIASGVACPPSAATRLARFTTATDRVSIA